MEFHNTSLIAISAVLLIAICLLLTNCKKDCFEEPNLTVPPSVANISLKSASFGPTYIGNYYYPNGVPDVLIFQSVNKFYSVRRFDPIYGSVSFYWSASVAPAFYYGMNYPFSPLQVG